MDGSVTTGFQIASVCVAIYCDNRDPAIDPGIDRVTAVDRSASNYPLLDQLDHRLDFISF